MQTFLIADSNMTLLRTTKIESQKRRSAKVWKQHVRALRHSGFDILQAVYISSEGKALSEEHHGDPMLTIKDLQVGIILHPDNK